MKTDYRDVWPINAKRTQREAGIPEGDFREEVRTEHWFWFAALFTLIVIAPAVVEWIA